MRFAKCGIAAGICLSFNLQLQARAEMPTMESIAQQLVEAPRVGGNVGVQISPDGKFVAYRVSQGSIHDNKIVEQWKVQSIEWRRRTHGPAVDLPAGARAVQWRPHSSTLSFLRAQEGQAAVLLCLYEARTGAQSTMSLPAIARTTQDERLPAEIWVQAFDYRWSPRGRFIAFTTALENHWLDPRRGVPGRRFAPSSTRTLFVYEIATGELSPVLDETPAASVEPFQFDWAPGESALVAAITPQGEEFTTASDLALIDLKTKKIRRLVSRPGGDMQPRWSPDGSQIAFLTGDGEPLRFAEKVPAFVSVKTGAVRSLRGLAAAFAAEGDLGWSNGWSPDGSALVYESELRLLTRRVRVDVATGESKVLRDPAGPEFTTLTGRSVSSDGRLLAYSRSGYTQPNGVYLVALTADGSPTGRPLQIAGLTEPLPLSSLVKIQMESWRSENGALQIHGVLLTPASAWRGKRIERPLPTLSYNYGGPLMVDLQFAEDGQGGAPIALAARGYAVLIPNTRGRGGYDLALLAGIRTSKSAFDVPLRDALAGVDALIGKGIADASRLGILGHSAGSSLSAYAVTATNRFRAAVLHDGMFSIVVPPYFGFPRGSSSHALARDYFGIHDPYDDAERRRMIEESAILHADRVKTPTLILGGEKCCFLNDGRAFYNALHSFNVPVALFAYDEDHVFEKPAAVVDNLVRVSEWLDYWVRGIPFPDAERAREYGM